MRNALYLIQKKEEKKPWRKQDQNSRSSNDMIKPLQKLIDLEGENWTSR